MKSFHSHSTDETIRIGRTFAKTLKRGDIVLLSGDLGTGKTHFIAGVCDSLGVRAHVASPTFTIINEYQGDHCTVVHIDLYRIATRREIQELGVEEYFDEQHICMIEWGERMSEFLPPCCIHVNLAYGEGDTDRMIVIEDADRKVERVGGIAV